MGLELPSGRANALALEGLGYLLIKDIGSVRISGLIKAGAPALAAVAAQGKITDQEDFAVDIQDASIHLSSLIREDAQVGQFVRDVFHVFRPISLGHAQVHEQALIDFTHDLIVNGHRGLGNALHNGSHISAAP